MDIPQRTHEPSPLLVAVLNLAAYHRDHEKFYSTMPLEQAVTIQRHARTLLALADRWTSVIATVEYYKNSNDATDCQDRIATQVKAIAALRQFSEKLRPYDMTYQLAQVRPSIDLYLNDPLPDPVRGEDGKPVRPPAKSAVSAAMDTLTTDAAPANEELAPGWRQISSVDLDDVTALTEAVQDLDFLAQDSPHWRRCEEALQVLVAAVRAQEGITGAPTSSPTGATTPAG